MISMIVKIGKVDSGIPMVLFPFPAIIFLSGVSFLVSYYCEPYVKSILMTVVIRRSH